MEPETTPPPLTVPRLLYRGATLRCAVCGTKGLFESWFRIRPRCPRCNFSMDRIEGHWMGSLGLNVIFSFGVLWLTLMVTMLATRPRIPVGPLIVAGGAVSILVPLAFFPFSKTLWNAVDLAMRPLEPDDDVDPRWLPESRYHE